MSKCSVMIMRKFQSYCCHGALGIACAGAGLKFVAVVIVVVAAAAVVVVFLAVVIALVSRHSLIVCRKPYLNLSRS